MEIETEIVPHKIIGKKRQANIEVLRILAMMMVISLHYLAKGNLLPDLTQSMKMQGYVAWLLESFSICAVDVYVIISGYFLVNTGFRCSRLIRLILQVLFYTILVPVVLIALGILDPSTITAYQILEYIFPVNMLHYWFISAYVLLFLFTPILNAAVSAMGKTQLKYSIILLLLMESVIKTVIPVRLELDNLGYDCLWFMVVYLIAAYIRIYGISFLARKGRAWKSYLLLVAVIYGLILLVRLLYLVTGKFENFIEAPLGYNHLATISAAVALFYTFYMWHFEGKMADFICKISPYTLGVYLLHEQVEMRYLWPTWLGAANCNSTVALIRHWIIAILVVLTIGLFVDWIRGRLFHFCGAFFAGKKLDQWLKRIDQKINSRGGERI